MKRILFSCSLLVLLFMASDCFAHKITVFGYVDQNLVKTESTFSGGRVAKGCTLSIDGADGLKLIGKTNADGMLDFPIPAQKEGFDLVVVCGDGHRGSWRIEAEEFIDFPESAGVSKPIDPILSVVDVAPPQATGDLRLILREELAAELGPIKRQLAELKQDTVSLADVVGGLGYFLGLAGLASYMRYRKSGK